MVVLEGCIQPFIHDHLTRSSTTTIADPPSTE
jgi:hypothetical protein